MTEMLYDADFDAMPGRALAARWVLTARLQLKTAAHFGGQAESSLDMPILRCARTGWPLLPGTSLGGALRAALLDRLTGYAEDQDAHVWKDLDREVIAKVFGAARADDAGGQSPLIVFDALGNLPEKSTSTEVRDGVMIETATGIAADQKKSDFEVLPPGTTFDVRFDLLIPMSLDEKKTEQETLSLLCASLECLKNGDVRLGMRRSRGLGEVSCEHWTAERFDLLKSDGWMQWIFSPHVKAPDTSSKMSVREAIQSKLPSGMVLDQPPEDRRKRIVIEAEAGILGDLLIRSPNAQADGPDVMQLSSGGRPILSGSSLAGVMRAQALRITRLVHELNRENAETDWIAPLFGPREEGSKNPNYKPRGSRLRVSERAVSNGQPQRVTRVAIDRFTQGVVDGALFEEQPHVGGTVQINVEIRNPLPGEIGLVLLVLKDLLTGQLPVGGTSSVGRGVLVGQSLIVSGAGVETPIKLRFDGVEARSGRVPDNDELNEFVQQFVQAKQPAKMEAVTR